MLVRESTFIEVVEGKEVSVEGLESQKMKTKINKIIFLHSGSSWLSASTFTFYLHYFRI